SKGLNGIAVTDHETVRGGLLALKIARKLNKDFHIIPGIEVKCRQGDIIGLGLESNPKKDMSELSAIEAVEVLRDMGALVVAPHPFGWGGVGKYLKTAGFDAVEGFNSNHLKCVNTRAKIAAYELKLPMVAGSDAHYQVNVGNGIVVIDYNEDTVDSALNAIRAGKVYICREKYTWNGLLVSTLRMHTLMKTIIGKHPQCDE
ncbi:MAG: PHP domain-containing protein, partial [Candidatus Jordarchaeaceae archaeon]